DERAAHLVPLVLHPADRVAAERVQQAGDPEQADEQDQDAAPAVQRRQAAPVVPPGLAIDGIAEPLPPGPLPLLALEHAGRAGPGPQRPPALAAEPARRRVRVAARRTGRLPRRDGRAD